MSAIATGLPQVTGTDLPHGFVLGVSNDEYHRHDLRISSTHCKNLLSCPEKARNDFENPPPPTKAMIVGSATHVYVLEGPEAFGKEFGITPPGDGRQTEVKLLRKEFKANLNGRTALKPEEGELIKAMYTAAHNNTIAKALIDSTIHEVSGYHTDPDTGAKCKIRPDGLDVENGLIFDLKTTIDASPSVFAREIVNRKYHLSAAMYAHGFEIITGKPLQDFIFICVEKSPPYCVAVYRLSDESMEAGRILYRRALNIYRQCVTSNEWPGYTPQIMELDIPAWARKTEADGE